MQWIYCLAFKANKHLKLMPQQISPRQAGASQMFRWEEIKGERKLDNGKSEGTHPSGRFHFFLTWSLLRNRSASGPMFAWKWSWSRFCMRSTSLWITVSVSQAALYSARTHQKQTRVCDCALLFTSVVMGDWNACWDNHTVRDQTRLCCSALRLM